ncbi:hypothetical protein REPUB_Repub09cG0173500 [Reevesia pubescens]
MAELGHGYAVHLTDIGMILPGLCLSPLETETLERYNMEKDLALRLCLASMYIVAIIAILV